MLKQLLFLLTFFFAMAAETVRAQQTVPPPPAMDSSRTYSYDRWDKPAEDRWGIIFYTQYSHLFYKAPPGLVEVHMAYRVVDMYGTAVSDTFSGSNNGRRRQMGNFFALPGIEVTHRNWSFEANASPFQLPRLGWRLNYYLGAGYRLRYDKLLSQAADLQPVMKNFPVTLSLGLQWHHALWQLGRIDMNYGDHFFALGHELYQTEDEPEEQESCHVDVVFQQSMLVVMPGLTVGWRPEDRHFDLSLRVSPYFPFTLESGFVFLFNDSDKDDPHSAPGFLSVIPAQQPGVHATFNGGRFPDTPYRMNGWLFSVRIGFSSGGIW